MSNETWNPNNHIKQVLADKFANVITALNKGDRDECKCLMVPGMMTQEEFNDLWPDLEQKITFNKFGRFKCRGYWFELRSVYSRDPFYCEGLSLEGYMLFIRKRNDIGISYYSPASDIIDHIGDCKDLSCNIAWDGIEVPESVLNIAENYVFNMTKPEVTNE